MILDYNECTLSPRSHAIMTQTPITEEKKIEEERKEEKLARHMATRWQKTKVKTGGVK